MKQQTIKIVDKNNNQSVVFMNYKESIAELYLSIKNKDNKLIKVMDFTQDQLDNELWKSIKLLPSDRLKENEKIILKSDRNIYVSNLGRILEESNNIYTLLQFQVKKNSEYREICLMGKDFRIHRLVAYLFIENNDYTNKPWVDHINSNQKYNNTINNLRWVHPMQNSYNKIDFDKSKCSTAIKGILYNTNSTRNKEPKVKLSLDGKEVIKIYNDVKELAQEYTSKQRQLIIRCCNQNLKNNTNKYNAIFAKWMFLSQYKSYYSDKNNQITHQIKNSAPNRYNTKNDNIDDILKLPILDLYNTTDRYMLELHITDKNCFKNETWKLMILPDDFDFSSHNNFNVLVKNGEIKRYFISNLGRIAAYDKKYNALVLKSISGWNSISLFNKTFSYYQIIETFLKR